MAEDPDKGQLVRFYMEPWEDPKASKEAGRPIFIEREFVHIEHAGERLRDFFGYAHEPFQLDRKNGGHITYAKRYPAQYKMFKERQAEQMIGTPLEHVPFLSRTRVAEMKALHVNTAEALRDLSERGITNLGMNTRNEVEQVRLWLDSALDAATANKALAEAAQAKAEKEELKDRIARLEAALANQQAGGPLVEDGPDGWSDDKLKSWLADRGVAVKPGRPNHKELAAAVKAMMADEEVTV
jgi:hypothetical protein